MGGLGCINWEMNGSISDFFSCEYVYFSMSCLLVKKYVL